MFGGLRLDEGNPAEYVIKQSSAGQLAFRVALPTLGFQKAPHGTVLLATTRACNRGCPLDDRLLSFGAEAIGSPITNPTI